MADGEKSKLAPLWHDVKASAKDAAMVIPRALASLLENPALTIIIMKTLVGLLLTGTIGAVVVEMAVKPGGHLAYVMLHDVLGFIDKLWSALSPIIDAVSDLINIVGGWLIGGFHVDLPDKLHLGDALDMFKDEGRMCNEFKSVEAEVGSNPKMVGRDKRCRVHTNLPRALPLFGCCPPPSPTYPCLLFFVPPPKRYFLFRGFS